MELSCNEFFATNMEIKTTASKRIAGKKETSGIIKTNSLSLISIAPIYVFKRHPFGF